MSAKISQLSQLFFTTLYISTFTFGGGFVIVSLMKKKIVDELHWIDDQEMLDLAALAQSSPGAIAVNIAVLIGWRISGFIGMVVAVLATIIPPLVILSLISLFYSAFASNYYIALLLRGMQAGVSAVVLDVACSLGNNVVKEHSVFSIILMILAFAAAFLFSINVVYIVLTAALIGCIKLLYLRRKEKRA